MNEQTRALKLISELIQDVQSPDFIWQLLIAVLCVGLAFATAKWWYRRHTEGAGRLKDAGLRLVFPLSGMVFSGVALLALKPFLHINLLKLSMPLFASMALVRGIVFVLRQAFPQATWLTTWERIIAATVWSWLALYITDVSPFVIESLEQFSFAVGGQTLNLWTILRGITTVFLTVVFALWIAGVIEARLMTVERLDNNLRIVGVRVAKAALTVIAVLTSLSLAGIDMTALSVFTGALGVGLGFGLQKIASNYVSGFIILLERSIRIGNIVQVSNEIGQVTQITTRYTVLKHPGGTEFIVPNETLMSSIVHNQTYSDSRVRLATTVGIAYDSDVDLAIRLMVETALAHTRILSEPAPMVLLTQFGDNAIQLELGFWIDDPDAGKGNVISDINLALLRAFNQNNIQIPFPQREVRMR